MIPNGYLPSIIKKKEKEKLKQVLMVIDKVWGLNPTLYDSPTLNEAYLHMN
jgi:hypothetical protein